MFPARWKSIPLLWLVLAGCARLLAHDTYLRLDDDVEAGEETPMVVFNGTFESSVDSIPADGVNEFGWLTGTQRTVLDNAKWQRGTANSRAWRVGQRVVSFFGGMDMRRTSTFPLLLPTEGSYAVFVTLHPSRTAMSPETWKAYTTEEGLGEEPEVKLEATGADVIITERYTKSAKSIVQVGEATTDDALATLGQPAEIVPLVHPSKIKEGDTVEFLLLIDGKPVANQVALAGQGAGDEKDHARLSLRSDASGRILIPISDDGTWWIRFIHMKRLPAGSEVNFESTWATLTFSVP